MKHEIKVAVVKEVYTDAQRASDERDDKQSELADAWEEYQLHGGD